GKAAIGRHCWYGYYIAMLGAALCCLYIALTTHRLPGEQHAAVWVVPLLLYILLVLGIMTNDLHMLAFRFPNGDLIHYEEYSYGPMIYVVVGYLVLLLTVSFLIILKKCRYAISRGYRLLPMLPVLFLLLYLLLNGIGRLPSYHGKLIWNIGEAFGFAMAGFLESCIQLGLIPANREYERLFRLTSLPAVILDREGALAEKTAGAQYPFPEDRDIEVREHPITGGSIRWTVDLRALRELNEKLEETTHQMEARNAYLEAENRMKQERTELETRNRLYDDILQSLRPQLDGIDSLTKQESFEEQLPRIAVLCAYVKRRSNMELLAQDGDLDAEELGLAIRETMEYVSLCGVHTAVTENVQGSLSLALVSAAYEALEFIVEKELDSLTDMAVILRTGEDGLSLRMLLRSQAVQWGIDALPPVGAGVSRQGFISRNREDCIVALRFTEGGGEDA
ncbi:MAG: hypothetical protein IJ792_05505, partial [Oscillospiraceae bacterium]|nr:hypothetical protein [Oscillospiraceae bacterium]